MSCNTVSQLIALVTTQLQYVAPCFRGTENLTKQDAPPRYVWVDKGERYTRTTTVGGNPRSLNDRHVTFDIHCWGASYDQAELLLLALITAVRTVMTANYELMHGETLPTTYENLGVVKRIEIAFIIPLPLVTLPSTSGGAVTCDGDPTVTITSVAFDTSGAVAGNNVLETGDT